MSLYYNPDFSQKLILFFDKESPLDIELYMNVYKTYARSIYVLFSRKMWGNLETYWTMLLNKSY